MHTLADLALPTGQFAMVAMDQRESLATMLREAGRDDGPAAMAAVKLDVARRLGGLASGFLIDREYGLEPIVRERALPAGCGLILAVDRLVQERGGPVVDTDLDVAALPEPSAERGADAAGSAAAPATAAVALKLLVIWKSDARRDERVALAARFIACCRERGLPAILEAVAPAPAAGSGAGLDDAILDAATALAALRPDIYKAQVPLRGLAPEQELVAACGRLARHIPVPWVVLSSGVPADAFPGAVRAACRAGASGMLAGRALWRNALTPGGSLADSARRLESLREVIGRDGRPWQEAR